MRIIGGRLKGRKLQAFKGSDVRPTADKVRESLFNIIGRQPEDACVLDLFAGTGALGIEALSRGARMAVFMDNSTGALNVLRKNLNHCSLQHCSRVIRWNIVNNLNCLKSYPGTFNLVFMDPPYSRGLIPLAAAHLLQSGCLSAAALLVAEHEASVPVELGAAPYTCIDSRRYGRTGLSFFSYQPG